MKNKATPGFLAVFSAALQLFAVPHAIGMESSLMPYVMTFMAAMVFFATNLYFFRSLISYFHRLHDSGISIELINVISMGLKNILVFASIYYTFGVIDTSLCQEVSVVRNDMLTSIYFSVVTWTTLGYGDIQPVKNLRLLSSFQALMGYSYMAILIGIFFESLTKSIKK